MSFSHFAIEQGMCLAHLLIFLSSHAYSGTNDAENFADYLLDLVKVEH